MSMRTLPVFLVFFPLLALSIPSALAEKATPTHVTATKSADDSKVVIQIDGKPFAEYLTLSGSKPVVWPIIGPTGKPMTRQYPMIDKGQLEKADHVHHRSLWFTHEKVNGHNFWHEPSKKDAAKQCVIKHVGFLKVESGEQAVVVTKNDWLDAEGNRVCQDERTLCFGGDENARWIDFDITLKATDGPVTLGDTKEGTMAVRVAAPLKPDAKMGGRLVNSEGQVNSKAWGKRAAWVDYSGRIDGEPVGICAMNHPTSFRYPTHWHARTYGLCAANPFGWKAFERDKSVDGSYTIPAGESITFRYRILFHKGAAASANLPEAFEAYAKMPK